MGKQCWCESNPNMIGDGDKELQAKEHVDKDQKKCSGDVTMSRDLMA